MNNFIRNFAILSHIDHGKTTLTDRLLGVDNRFLDSHPIEKERGITIKLSPVRMFYTQNNKRYTFNLIDTPGHVDFAYEVSRSLAACEGALLLVDATQGIQAQTIANAYLAIDNGLTLIPVINKIDLPNSDIASVTKDLEQTFAFRSDEIISISAKKGTNISQLLRAIVKRIPPPKGVSTVPPRALVFNSHFDQHKGVITAVRVFAGTIHASDQLQFLATKTVFTAKQVGIFSPDLISTGKLSAGSVGYIATGLKDISFAKVGDTITSAASQSVKPLPGYQEPKPLVFMDLYPIDGKQLSALTDALAKLKLTDAALSVDKTNSQALGYGFKVGFLGLLHAEIVRERLRRDFNLELIATTPTVNYQVTFHNGQVKNITSAANFPDPASIKLIQEPIAKISIFTDSKYLGDVIRVTLSHRASNIDQQHFGAKVNLKYLMPLSELLKGYYDQLKSVSSGFASLDYELAGYQPSRVVKLEIYLNKQPVPALFSIVIKDQAQIIGRHLVETLKTALPRQQFAVPIQAVVGGTIVARATLKAFRKDVTAKLYGGDQTRKDKLLKKQKKGKKRLKSFGKVDIPQEAFLAVLRR